MALWSVYSDGVVAEPCYAMSPVLYEVQTSPEFGCEACSHQPLHCLGLEVPPIKAHISNLASRQCPNLMEL